jgi:hypothetical protein
MLTLLAAAHKPLHLAQQRVTFCVLLLLLLVGLGCCSCPSRTAALRNQHASTQDTDAPRCIALHVSLLHRFHAVLHFLLVLVLLPLLPPPMQRLVLVLLLLLCLLPLLLCCLQGSVAATAWLNRC